MRERNYGRGGYLSEMRLRSGKRTKRATDTAIRFKNRGESIYDIRNDFLGFFLVDTFMLVSAYDYYIFRESKQRRKSLGRIQSVQSFIRQPDRRNTYAL